MRTCTKLGEGGSVAFPDNYGSRIAGNSAEKSNAKAKPGIASGETFTTAEKRDDN